MGSTTRAKQEHTVEGQRNTAEATDRIKPAAAEAAPPDASSAHAVNADT